MTRRILDAFKPHREARCKEEEQAVLKWEVFGVCPQNCRSYGLSCNYCIGT
ncbi:hypothetical protein Mapa_008020 [Marchantia paleacea]|nr:hypothetical protein Mapa_008020 [Marchantia paleacea]